MEPLVTAVTSNTHFFAFLGLFNALSTTFPTRKIHHTFFCAPVTVHDWLNFFFYHGDSLSSSPQPFDLSSKHVKRGHKLKLIANLHILKMLFSFSVSLDENLNFPIKQVACMGRKKCCLLFLNITFRSDLVKCQINMGNWKKSKPKIRRIRVWMALFKP